MRIPGTLIGSAIGDAMGAPFEGTCFLSSIPEKMVSGGPFSVRKGEYTDDTLQMIALAETLVTCRGFSRIDFLRRLLAIQQLHPEYFGPTSSRVLEKIRCGILPETASQHPPGGGRTNGAVMRGAPIGIFYRPEHALTISREAAATTHPHPVAVACSGFVNLMVSVLCRGGSREQAFFHALKTCDNDEVKKRLALLSHAPLIPSTDALDTTHAAVTCWMEEPNFKSMIVRAICLGGDTDTIAAICGALGGAFFGVSGIPADWMNALEGAGSLLALEEKVWSAGEQ